MANVFSNEISRDELKPGDHIYSWRSGFLYAHHGIYIGDDSDDKVIHFTSVGQDRLFPVSSSSSSFYSSGIKCLRCDNLQEGRPKEGVIISCLDCFLDGQNLNCYAYSVSKAFFLAKVRGGTCTMADSDPPHEVIHRAKYLLNHGFGSYDLFKNNCEDFAIYCKTGLVVVENGGRSGQVNSLKASIAIPLALATFVSPLATTATTYFVCKYKSDMGVRDDVVKIPVEELVGRFGIQG